VEREGLDARLRIQMVRWLLRRCIDCGRYTLREDECPYCGGKVRIPHPAKFSIDDKYAKYRSMMRRISRKS
jgi:H/ACA ribonucleoprotein complex subunit 3